MDLIASVDLATTEADTIAILLLTSLYFVVAKSSDCYLEGASERLGF